MRSASHWRAGLVDKSTELLPEVQQQQVKTGKLSEIVVSPALEVDISAKSDLPKVKEPNSASLLVPSSIDSSLILRMDKPIPSLKPLVHETPSKLGGFANNYHFELGNYGSPSISHGSSFTGVERGLKPPNGISKNFKFVDTTTPGIHRVSSMTATALKEFNRISSRLPQHGSFLDHQSDKVSSEKEQNGSIFRFQNTRPSSFRVPAEPSGSLGLFKDSAQDLYLNMSAKRVPSDGPWKVVPSDDVMDISLSQGEKDSPDEDVNANGRSRWRSDDTSEDEGQQSPDRFTGIASDTAPMRGIRRSRFARR
uniref:Uncharacterized protein n=1 Tax=Davidia involucrata TaxID=16924 RepID=A0A5B6Z9U7_DAVIN